MVTTKLQTYVTGLSQDPAIVAYQLTLLTCYFYLCSCVVRCLHPFLISSKLLAEVISVISSEATLANRGAVVTLRSKKKNEVAPLLVRPVNGANSTSVGWKIKKVCEIITCHEFDFVRFGRWP